MEYLKKFESYSQYQDYIEGSGAKLPNVSYVDPKPVVEVTVRAWSTSYEIPIIRNTSLFSELYIDGVKQPSVVGSYIFDTTGEHTIRCTLVDGTSIGNSAFYEIEITDITTIPGSVTSIGNLAFSCCNELTSVIIPNNVINIGDRAFSGSEYIESMIVPDTIENIGDYAFSSNKFDSFTIPPNITVLSEGIFNHCTKLSNITIPSKVTTICSEAFGTCVSLKSIFIPKNVINIEQSLFGEERYLESITVDPLNTIYDSRDNCNAIIESSTNTLIAGCKNTIIPNSITSIGWDAFGGCRDLQSIVIPQSVSTIEGWAFEYCESLTSVTCLREIPPSLGNSVFHGTHNHVIYVPANSVEAYRSAWPSESDRIWPIPSS